MVEDLGSRVWGLGSRVQGMGVGGSGSKGIGVGGSGSKRACRLPPWNTQSIAAAERGEKT